MLLKVPRPSCLDKRLVFCRWTRARGGGYTARLRRPLHGLPPTSSRRAVRYAFLDAQLNIEELDRALARLEHAVQHQRSPQHCLRLWSSFIRLRDGKRCVVCNGAQRLAAHHVARKTLFSIARFQTGNGITLCSSCHSEPHEGFNGRPDLEQPMDAEGGEKIELMMDLFRLLAQDAHTRGLVRDDYYFLSDQLLDSFKKFQDLPLEMRFPGMRVAQAYLIWRQTPRRMLNAILEANGLALPNNFVQRGSIGYDNESDR
jgi:hypothetical protein